jgi:hypothetical protein
MFQGSKVYMANLFKNVLIFIKTYFLNKRYLLNQIFYEVH